MATMMAQGFDGVTEFRSHLFRTQHDGTALADALTRLTQVHPLIGAAVIRGGSLGIISRERAVSALRTYMVTGVASAPDSL